MSPRAAQRSVAASQWPAESVAPSNASAMNVLRLIIGYGRSKREILLRRRRIADHVECLDVAAAALERDAVAAGFELHAVVAVLADRSLSLPCVAGKDKHPALRSF